MGWEAATAVDVEHMPLMIHTLCAVGRWWLPSPLPLPLSRMGLLCFFFSVVFFSNSTPHMETSGKLKCVVYTQLFLFNGTSYSPLKTGQG